MVNPLKSGSTIGIIGGGQLGRMMAIAAKQMGFHIAVLDPTPNSPTGQVADIEIVASYDDLDAAKQLLQYSDVITYEFENIDVEVCRYLEQHGSVPQGSELIRMTQDRANEKEAIVRSGAKVVDYELVNDGSQLRAACRKIGFPVVLKTRRGGYDGKGQLILRSEADYDLVCDLLANNECILEKFLPFEKEISVIVNRSVNGDIRSFPVAENIHHEHILLQSIVPARISPNVASKAREVAEQLAQSMEMVGTLGVEMFLTKDDDIYINELAPRPHNSGHYTLDACSTNQFEQHIRAITGYALGSTCLTHPVVMMNVLGQHLPQVEEKIPAVEDAKIHLYGKKEAKEKRKMGHINFLTKNIDEAMKQIHQLRIWRTES